MKFHSIIRRFLFSACAVATLSACSNIAEDQRWQAGGAMTTAAADRSTILVEEYTGQNCVNCPAAAKLLHDIAHEDQDHIITMALHAECTGQTATLASPLANTYAKAAGVTTAIPGIVVNRSSEFGSKFTLGTESWSNRIKQAVDKKATCRIKLIATPDVNRQVKVTVKATAVNGAATDKALKLQLLAVEDIRGYQETAHGHNNTYLHRNVLRGALNGPTGEDFALNQELSHTYTLPESVAEVNNAKVIAFLYDAKTGEIREAAIDALAKGITETADDNAEEAGSNATEQQQITFKLGEKQYASGATITGDKSTKTPQGDINVSTPSFYIIPAKDAPQDNYTLDITKEDHKDASWGGLSQVCIGGQCVGTDNAQSHHEANYKMNAEGLFHFNYLIAKAHAAQPEVYTMRLSVKRDGTEVAYVFLKFDYKPEKVENLGQPTEPTEPEKKPESVTPDPTPSFDATRSNIVVMDFTQQNCPGCSYIKDELKRYEDIYGDHLIAVAFHRRDRLNWDPQFISPDGDTYNNGRIRYYPTMFVNNNKELDNNYNESRYFGREIPAAIKTPAAVHATLSAKLEGEEGSYKVSYTYSCNPTSKGAYLKGKALKVIFWVTENQVYGYQVNRGYIYHDHIHRGHFGQTWGNAYTFGSKMQRTDDMPAKVLKAKNCELIAILVDGNTFIDAVRVKLSK